jgi:hypothetical protein
MSSRDYFQLILKFFDMVDNRNHAAPGEPGYDPCAKFQPLVEYVKMVFRHHYMPHQQLSVDESLVSTVEPHKFAAVSARQTPSLGDQTVDAVWFLNKLLFCIFLYQGSECTEDKDVIQKYCLAYTVVMKLLKMGNYI